MSSAGGGGVLPPAEQAPGSAEEPPEPVADDEASERNVAELVLDVSERLAILVREEIELAKAEISEKLQKLLRGSVAGIAAGLFVVLGFIMLMHAFAWLLNDLFFGDRLWLGFLVEGVLWFAIAAAAGIFAYRSVKAGAPPVPSDAIEHAKIAKRTLSSDEPSAEAEQSVPAGTPGPGGTS